MGPMGQKAAELFKEELGYIHSPVIQEFVLQVADQFCQESFWTRPASKTGRYHPALSLGEGGLVRHTKLAVWWAAELCRSLDDPSGRAELGTPTPHKDAIVAACILHDMMKDPGPHSSSSNTTACHGVDLACAIFRVMFNKDVTRLTREQMLILYGIAGHMGVWTGPDEKHTKYRPSNITDAQTSFVAQVVHLADYCASRKVDAFTQRLVERRPAPETRAGDDTGDKR